MRPFNQQFRICKVIHVAPYSSKCIIQGAVWKCCMVTLVEMDTDLVLARGGLEEMQI